MPFIGSTLACKKSAALTIRELSFLEFEYGT